MTICRALTLVGLAVLVCGNAACHATPVRDADRSNLGSCRVFPPDNEWNRDISRDPVDPRSDDFLASMNAAGAKLHPDFGRNPKYGIPWIAVAGHTPRMAMQFEYAHESDPGPYPFPPDAPIEGGASATGDRHVIAIDRDACKLYEAFACTLRGERWSCGSGAVFDLRSNQRRPDGWTSADAAGLPIFAGLVRRDEVAAGRIQHALRFTVRRTQKAYAYPATHHAGHGTDPALPPMGLRVRLKSGFDLAPYSGSARVILEALKRYGMFLADNGSDWFVSGEPHPDWDDDELRQLKRVPASAFEVVALPPLRR